MTKSARLRKLLKEGPATTREVADTLGWDRRTSEIAMWVLTHMKHARKIGRIKVEGVRGIRLTSWLNIYELTPHGRYMLQRDRRKRQMV